VKKVYAPRRPRPTGAVKPPAPATGRKLALVILALTLTPSWCFDQRCYIGEPAGIERTYLRPSLLWCHSEGGCGVYLLGKIRQSR
jgi:hypothetical protein